MTNYPATVDSEAPGPQTTRAPGHLPHAIGFWVVAVAYAALSAFGTAPTPRSVQPGTFLTGLAGVAIGLVSATATTYLADLDQQARPHITAPLRRGMVAAGASLGGLALGPTIAGATAEWLPDALLLPYVVFGLILLGNLVFVLVTPETVDISAQAEFRVRRVHIQNGKRTIFIGASVWASRRLA